MTTKAEKRRLLLADQSTDEKKAGIQLATMEHMDERV